MITSYATLQTEIADWLNRADLTSAVKTFIQNAENKFRRDERVRRLARTTLLVSADAYALPSDYAAIEGLWFDGSTYYGEIEIVPAARLGELKDRLGDTGVPRFAAVVNGTLYFAPVPEQEYTLTLHYWMKLTALETASNNWLLAGHPDIYLYGALVESAPYLQHDPRVATWKAELEERLNELDADTRRNQFSGTMRRRVRRVIGG